MFKSPSRQRKKRAKIAVNLVPIMDGVFIVVFFLLITASSERSFKIKSDVPVVAQENPEEIKKTPPLALALSIGEEELVLTSGFSSKNTQVLLTIKKNSEGFFDLEQLHQKLIELKTKYPKEESVIFKISSNTIYEKIIDLMDTVRELRTTDQEIYVKDEKGFEKKLEGLFPEIIFGDLQS